MVRALPKIENVSYNTNKVRQEIFSELQGDFCITVIIFFSLEDISLVFLVKATLYSWQYMLGYSAIVRSFILGTKMRVNKRNVTQHAELR